LFGWLAPSQPAVFFSHTNSASASSHQPASSIFSQNKSAPATSNQPAEQDPSPCLVLPILPQISLYKKKIPYYIKISANA
jgi:hypothetical protein